MKEFLKEGWHPIETDGAREWVWSSKEATLCFPAQHQGFSLELSGCPSRETPLAVLHQDKVVASHILANVITCVNIPAGITSCRISMPHPWSPHEVLSSLDQRQLGICLHGVHTARLYAETCTWPPQIIEMNLVGICNITYPCVMCIMRHSPNHPFVPYQDDGIISQMIPYLNQAKIVSLHGVEGEPLISPRLLGIIGALDTNKIYVMFASNGLLLTEETSRKIIALGLREINFSIDAATPSTYRKIRNNDGFSMLIDNIARLVALKKELGVTSPQVIINMVLMKANLKELPDFIELAYKIGADVVLIRFLVPILENYEVTSEVFKFNYFEQKIDPNSKEFKEIMKAVKVKALQRKVTIQSDNPEIMQLLRKDTPALGIIQASEKVLLDLYGEILKEYVFLSPPELVCQRPWQSALIGLGGDVRFCCHSRKEIGNLHQNSFEAIWNGDIAKDIRTDFLKEVIPQACVACPLRFKQDEIWQKSGN